MSTISLLFGNEGDDIRKSASFWNAVTSFINALQSTVLIFVITRVCGDAQAGILSYALSVSYLMLMIGNYGVRNFQATDIKEQYSAQSYLNHRIISCLLMCIISLIYVFLHHYSLEKMIVVLLACLLKLIECIEDVFHGEYQRRGRLDVAGKIGSIRLALTICSFVISLVFTRDQIVAFAAMNIVSAIALILLTGYTYPKIVITKSIDRNWYHIFISCFPLFLASFFNIYICNASKYAINSFYPDEIQAYYGMLFMPIFVIDLLFVCLYRPYLVQLANYWDHNSIRDIEVFVKKQLLIILGISVIAFILGYFCGTIVLSLIFGTDLCNYSLQFLVLLFGGSLTAVVGFLNNLITVMRRQNVLIWIYGIVFLFAFLFTKYLVQKYELMGASIAFSASLLIQACLMATVTVIIIERKKKSV